MPWYRMRMDLGGLGEAVFHLCGKNMPSPCSVCGYLGGRLCDWKLPNGKDCDRQICEHCSTEPTPGKDICPAHVGPLKAWLAGRTNTADGLG